MKPQIQVKAQGPTTGAPDVPAGYIAVWDDAKMQWNVIRKEQAGGIATQGDLLVSASVEEFLDLFYPLKIKEIEVGDRVYNRSTKRFGHVIRASENSFRVETDKKIGTYWEQELEVR